MRLCQAARLHAAQRVDTHSGGEFAVARATRVAAATIEWGDFAQALRHVPPSQLRGLDVRRGRNALDEERSEVSWASVGGCAASSRECSRAITSVLHGPRHKVRTRRCAAPLARRVADGVSRRATNAATPRNADSRARHARGSLATARPKVRQSLAVPWTADASPRTAALLSAPAGVLLHGPTGCGKSFLASVIAAECDANFVAVRASDVASKYVRGSDPRALVACKPWLSTPPKVPRRVRSNCPRALFARSSRGAVRSILRRGAHAYPQRNRRGFVPLWI